MSKELEESEKTKDLTREQVTELADKLFEGAYKDVKNTCKTHLVGCIGNGLNYRPVIYALTAILGELVGSHEAGEEQGVIKKANVPLEIELADYMHECKKAFKGTLKEETEKFANGGTDQHGTGNKPEGETHS